MASWRLISEKKEKGQWLMGGLNESDFDAEKQ